METTVAEMDTGPIMTSNATSPPPDASHSVSVVVPCYNEAAAIEATLTEIWDLLKALPHVQIIAVDDGSTDGSGEVIDKLIASGKIPSLAVKRHTTNQGYGAALKSGIRMATGELIAITDADGTYPNDRLPELIELAHEHDMVVGSRTGDDVVYPLIRKIPKAFLRRYASWIAGQEIPDMNSGLRVFRKSIAERFLKLLPNGFSFTTTITLALMHNHYQVHFVPINYAARVGDSKIRPIRDTLLFVQLIVRMGMYFAPLRVLGPISLVLFFGFALKVTYDLYEDFGISDSALLLGVTAFQTLILGLIADMIDKRSAG